MSSEFIPSKNFSIPRVGLLLRLAGLVAVFSGLIGGFVWLLALIDRSDGDDLRWGFFHNPFMQFFPLNEPFLDASMWLLFACSAAVGVGGLMLLAPRRWGVPLVTWQARVSIIINGVIACFIVVMMYSFAKRPSEEWDLGLASEALGLRLGSITLDAMLWRFLGSNTVREFIVRQSHPPERAFEVIMNEPDQSS